MLNPDFIVLTSEQLYRLCIYFMYMPVNSPYNFPYQAEEDVKAMTQDARIEFFRNEMFIPDDMRVELAHKVSSNVGDRVISSNYACILDMTYFKYTGLSAAEHVKENYQSFLDMFSDFSVSDCYAPTVISELEPIWNTTQTKLPIFDKVRPICPRSIT